MRKLLLALTAMLSVATLVSAPVALASAHMRVPLDCSVGIRDEGTVTGGRVRAKVYGWCAVDTVKITIQAKLQKRVNGTWVKLAGLTKTFLNVLANIHHSTRVDTSCTASTHMSSWRVKGLLTIYNNDGGVITSADIIGNPQRLPCS